MRKTTLCLSGVLLAATPFVTRAEDAAPAKPADGGDPAAKRDEAAPAREPGSGRDEGAGGWSERLLDQYRDRLNLSTEQAGKIREVLSESRKRRDEARQEADARVREILTDAQRGKFEELRRGGRDRGPGGAGPGGSGMPFAARWLAPAIEDLQRELKLTDEQRQKVDAIVQASLDGARARFEESSRSGFQGLDRQALRGEFEKLFEDTSEKIKPLLTAEQQEKYAKRVEERRKVFQGFMRRGDERPSPQDRVNRALEALKIDDPDESKAVKALLAHVAQLQDEMADFDRSARDKARDMLKTDGISEETISQRVEDLRTSRRAIEGRLDAAESELRQITSSRQELALIQLGLLR